MAEIDEKNEVFIHFDHTSEFICGLSEYSDVIDSDDQEEFEK